MPNTTLKMPTTWGGISKQDKHLRHPNQVEDAKNILFDIRYGATKRPGSSMVTAISGLTADGNYRLHAIKRDDTEKYLMLYGESTLRAFDLTGAELTVNVDADAQTYLDSNTPASEELKLTTVADYTIITNTTVAIVAERSDSFSVDASYEDYDRMIRSQPAQNDFIRAREDTAAHVKGYWQYTYGPATFEHWEGTGSFTLLSGYDEGSHPWPSSWFDPSKNPMGVKIGYRTFDVSESSVTWTAATKRITKVGAFAGYTWSSGDVLHITGGTGVTKDLYEIASKVDDDTLEMTDAIDASDRTNWTIDGIGVGEEVNFDLTERQVPDTIEGVFEIIQDAFYESGSFSVDTLTFVETSTATTHWPHLIAPTAGTDGGILGIFTPDTPGVFDLSAGVFAESRFNTKTAGTGSPAELRTPKEERWTRVAAPSQSEAEMKATTMPIKVVRQLGPPVTFNASTIDWKPRTSGDSVTNPIPSIWSDSHKISDLIFHRNRLLICADVHLVFSQAGDFFNFFNEVADNIVDSDPIDLPISSNRVNIIESVAPFDKGALIFTKAGQQFELGAPEVLRQDTATADESTTIKTQKTQPIVAGNFAYFAGVGSNNTAEIFEYYFREELVSADADPITAHVFGLMPQTVRTIEIIQNTNTLYVLPEDGQKLLFYRYFWAGNRKQQAAWGSFELDTGANSRFVDIAAIDDDLYALVENDNGFAILKMPSSMQGADTGMPYPVHLDRIQMLTGVHSGVSGGGTTSFTHDTTDETLDAVVLGPAFGADAGKLLPGTTSGGTTIVAGEYDLGECYVGKLYDAEMTLNQFFRRDRDGVANLGDDVYIEAMDIQYWQSGTFSIKRTMSNRVDAVRTKTVTDGTHESGRFRANLQGRASMLDYIITATDHRPATFTSVEVYPEVTKEVV